MNTKWTVKKVYETQIKIKNLSKTQLISYSWLIQYLQNLKNRQSKLSSKIILPEELRFFKYQPKGMATLPFYDRCPISLVISADKTSFVAINFHYLSENIRKFLIAHIMQFANNMNILTYIKQYRGSPVWKFAIKKYLVSHIVSPVYLIPKEEWPFVINLPNIARFMKKQQNEVINIGRMKYRSA